MRTLARIPAISLPTLLALLALPLSVAPALAAQPPSVAAPASVNGAEGTLVQFTVTASDPSASPITSLAASSLPNGATFTTSADNSSGTFAWTPDFTQAGSYTVTFDAVSVNGTGTASTSITVSNTDRAPVVTAPAVESVTCGTLVPVTFTVTAADPDGDAITSLTAAPLPSGATFTANASKTSGTFSWTPGLSQCGTYNVTFTASNVLSGTATTQISVQSVDLAPVVTAPAAKTVAENSNLTFTVSAADPNGDAIASLVASGTAITAGGTFTVNPANTSGTFSWTPSFTQAGSYTVAFTASNSLSGSASTAITVNNVDRPPVVAAPATATTCPATLLTFTVSASDPDGDPISSLTASGTALTAGGAFTAGAGNTSGTFSWTPTFSQAGSYSATFTASNALSGSATTAITVGCPDRAPVVTAPASESVCDGVFLKFTVLASDPDGDAITSLTAAPLPPGATFTAGAGNTSGTFAWTPSFTAGGTYNVTFTAQNALTGSAATSIMVLGCDRPPVVTAPATETVAENVNLTFTVLASDPDGDAIASLVASGTAITAGGTFTVNPANTSGTFSWTPSFIQSGSYTVAFTASNSLSGSASTAITVTNVNRCPVMTAPATETVNEGMLLTFGISATDPDGDHVTLTATGLPLGATFTDNGNTTGTFTWTPDFNAFEAGPAYTVTFHGNDNAGCSTASATTVITVVDVNRPPVAIITAPPTGVANVPVGMSASLSADPDGDALIYAWGFGDGGTASGVLVSHTYSTAAGSPFTISLTVTDTGTPPLGNTATQQITIVPCRPGTLFAVGGNKTTNLGSDRPFTCLQVQPATATTFNVADVILGSITLKRTDVASTPITAAGKTAIEGDRNGDGIQEISACFTKTDLRVLFAGLPSGTTTVPVEIDGNLVDGSQFCAPGQMVVKSNGSLLAATLSPNPFNPEAVLTFSTSKAGAAQVTMYDVSGRQVRSLMNETSLAAGYHDVRIDGRGDDGAKLASGLYFVKIDADGDGETVMKAMIMK